MNILIPPPISSYHSELVNLKKLGGNELTNHVSKTNLIVVKGGLVRPVELSVRFCRSIYNTLEMVGTMNFNLKKTMSCVVLTDHMGMICAVTGAASKFFKKGMSLFLYNREFEDVYSVSFLFSIGIS